MNEFCRNGWSFNKWILELLHWVVRMEWLFRYIRPKNTSIISISYQGLEILLPGKSGTEVIKLCYLKWARINTCWKFSLLNLDFSKWRQIIQIFWTHPYSTPIKGLAYFLYVCNRMHIVFLIHLCSKGHCFILGLLFKL